MKNYRIGNLNLYKGTKIKEIICGPSFDERFFFNFEKFDQDRHNLENGKQQVDYYALMPFSRGVRICPGKGLA
jgi:cytochrome P450